MGVNVSVRTCTPGPTADNSMAFVYNNNTQGLDVYLQMAGQTNVLELANERQVGSTITGSISLESVSCLRPLHIKKLTHRQTGKTPTEKNTPKSFQSDCFGFSGGYHSHRIHRHCHWQ